MYSLFNLFGNFNLLDEIYPTRYYTGGPIEVNLAGVPKEDIQVGVKGNTLAVKTKATKEGRPVYREVFLLSKDVDKTAITASYKDGMLILDVPPREDTEFAIEVT